MRLQLLSDLHLETEDLQPRPAPGAELLVLAGDVCARWEGFGRFRGWPVPVLFVPGNHEFDQRELREALPALRAHCAGLGIRLLEREHCVLRDRAGARIRFVGTVRWSDFEVFGPAGRERAMRAATYYVQVMRATCDGRVFDAAAVREESLACRRWLAGELARRPGEGDGEAWDRTVVVTHYAPSLRSADPRYGHQPGTASFCNADDDLLPAASTWIHGHLHCRHDYLVAHPGGGTTRVVSNARGHARRGESEGHDPDWLVEV
ncbi:metallophosphoesterase [Piscinibacter sakaiensis]|uniref:Ser/Thr protein phosphatase family protein n=1 Tax=Piscinibacter sakaiensis TaxID=1547922 RepID=A0A0K8P4N8_PISS1|nr:metallophosphoesterase [Piscinibacter sakaiensis]GAP37622.1 Ser/Thr protein phosphatase family protein [Piscinibacter sakaiensis]